jgi:hypothetical protein
MTNNIYPPDHLLRKWESLIIDEEQNVDVVLYEAFQAGADQELEACCEWLKAKEWIHPEFSDELRAARRPKPPSLKEQALESLHHLEAGCAPNVDLLRRALESLPS